MNNKVIDVDYIYKKDTNIYNSIYIYGAFLVLLFIIFFVLIYKKYYF